MFCVHQSTGLHILLFLMLQKNVQSGKEQDPVLRQQRQAGMEECALKGNKHLQVSSSRLKVIAEES